ncbi:MAG: prenyltransferase [Tepidanaerobacteraceae bacterium]|jgi:1,4-dihydroxy-2-naphthoate octaprenyltransferase|nr:prenyltransferase [Tepidanaerobacteraceae bacterium]HQE04651.1 prenyltransferase [Tepidanaerobacteraceae bacterium]
MASSFSRLIQGVWRLADPKLCIASTVPMVVSTAMAYKALGYIDIYWLFLSFFGVYLIETGKNAINEVVDYKSGVDRFVTPDKRTPFSGGKKTIVDGLLTVEETKIIALVTMLAAAAIGLYIAIAREPMVLWIGIAGFLISIFYSLPPFKFCYRGLGEFAIGLTYGPLVVSGTYLVQTHTVNLEILLLSLMIGFLIANVVWINQYPDYEADARGNKRNWVVRLGKEKGIVVYILLYVLAYLSLLIAVFFTGNPLLLIALLSAPIAKRSVDVAKKYYDDIARLVEANAKTIQVYQMTGLTLTAAILIG